jgi:hypothetical protein
MDRPVSAGLYHAMKRFLKNRANIIWLILVAATALTFELGEHGATGSVALAILLGLTWLKGYLIISDFMELRHAQRLWQILIGGWLCLIIAVITFAYAIGMR